MSGSILVTPETLACDEVVALLDRASQSMSSFSDGTQSVFDVQPVVRKSGLVGDAAAGGAVVRVDHAAPDRAAVVNVLCHDRYQIPLVVDTDREMKGGRKQHPEQGEVGQRGGVCSNVRYGTKITLNPSDRLKNAGPAAGSRYQAWKFHVDPAVICVAAVGGAEKSTWWVMRPTPI